MSRLLLFGLVGLVVYLVLRDRRRGASGGTVRGPRPAEQMVLCAQCGVHLPEGESLRSGEHCYCCEAHRVLGPVKRPS
ncbi:hypothetical protein GALL_342900 [mine drainage metagenome]|uniref:Uncharacterized protein n=1 Tax=mine drainage metagenome TaxID=410659 RepID=A0A1J5QK28_9ZZZZ